MSTTEKKAIYEWQEVLILSTIFQTTVRHPIPIISMSWFPLCSLRDSNCSCIFSVRIYCCVTIIETTAIKHRLSWRKENKWSMTGRNYRSTSEQGEHKRNPNIFCGRSFVWQIQNTFTTVRKAPLAVIREKRSTDICKASRIRRMSQGCSLHFALWGKSDIPFVMLRHLRLFVRF